jgi:hypothetical protein
MGKRGHRGVARLRPSSLPAIFGHPQAEYTVPLLRRILNIFYQKLQRNEAHADLLTKLSVLENRRSNEERDTVSQLLRRRENITRAAIRAGVQPEDEDEEEGEDEQSDQPGQGCDICLVIKPASSFPQGKIAPGCNHAVCICRLCLTLQIKQHAASLQEAPLMCASCPTVLPLDTVELHTTPEDCLRCKAPVQKMVVANI